MKFVNLFEKQQRESEQIHVYSYVHVNYENACYKAIIC